MADTATVDIADFQVGAGHAPLLIVGPCVLEDTDTALRIAGFMKEAAAARFQLRVQGLL